MIQIKSSALHTPSSPVWRRVAAGLLRSVQRLGLGLALAGTAAWAQDAAQKLPSVALRAGFHAISAEVARTPEQRAIGLMHRKEMAPHEGMLFVFETPAVQCFWMKNTLIPLSIAFLADDGRIVNIADMQPQTLDSHCSEEPVRLALEMNQGWFARRGIKPGMRIQGGPIAPAR